MLPENIVKAIEKDYGGKITQLEYLNKGRKGAVFFVEVTEGLGDVEENASMDDGEAKAVKTECIPSRKIFCVKKISKDNCTARKDFEGYSTVYEKEFDFKLYEDQEYQFFTMPFFPGKSLDKYIKAGLDLETRLTIFCKIVEATQCMHALGVIHTDLKPENIIIDKKAKDIDAYIIDFGRSIRVFDHQTGKALSAGISLSLVNSSNLFTQVRRKFQTQTAPEYTSIFNLLKKWLTKDNKFLSEYIIGFRSDYYGLGVLFKKLVSEPEYALLAEKVIKEEGIARDDAYHELYAAILTGLGSNSGKEEIQFIHH